MKIIAILLLVFVDMLSTAFAQNPNLKPYLQAPTPTSLWVTWKLGPSSRESVVKFGTAPTVLDKSFRGNTSVYSDAGYNNNYYYHSVKLVGLVPNTKYYYKIISGADSSAIYSFRTLPLPGQPATADGHLRFLFMGDNQIKAQPRYDSMVVAAKRKLEQLGGGEVNDYISMILNVGDQVDVGTLDHYENVHFKKSSYISPYSAITTIVGNHETYGTLGMSAYRNHFFYDSLSYQGISSGTEDHYAIQAGNVLFLNLNTENTSAAQFSWVQQVVNRANTDTTVEWIVSLAHRPYQAEQYIGDISTWIRNTVVPFLNTSPKFVLHFGAHHHLYARGQIKDKPVYHLISGGTAWDQYWGMSTEQDYDDVQKTISNWGYQIVDFDKNKKRVDVECYSVGSIYNYHNNRLIDKFYRIKGQPKPNQPLITAAFGDSIRLPFNVTGSAFSSANISEQLNTTEFQISSDKNGRVIEKTILRDFEDFFGSAGRPDTTIDKNKNIDIKNLNMPIGFLSNGKHFIRVRHRDKNLEWSDWSPVDSFKIVGSSVGLVKLKANKDAYSLTDTIKVTFSGGPGNPQDWIGVYRLGDTPGPIASRQWKYVTSGNGVITFQGLPSNTYFVAYFINNRYTEIATRVTFYVGSIAELSSAKSNYRLTDTVKIKYVKAPAFANDWIGIYKIGMTPGGLPSLFWRYTAGDSGTVKATGLGKGYYFAQYFIKDGYTSPGNPEFFSIGDTITRLSIDKSVYQPGEYITATWSDAPGNPKDWLGVYDSVANPFIVPLISFTYIAGRPEGALSDSIAPKRPGSYFICLFTNDSYTEVSNRVHFKVMGPLEADKETASEGVKITVYPNPTSQAALLESPYPIDEIRVYNSNMQEVFYSSNVKSQTYNFLCHQLPEGTYFIKTLLDNRKSSTFKLVVSR
jgi:hypothetical protein